MHQLRVRLQRLEWIGDRLEDFVVHLDGISGLARVKPRVGDDHREKISHAARGLASGDEHGQIGNIETCPALSRHVSRREHSHDARQGQGRGRANRQNVGSGVLTEDHRAVQHSRSPHVADKGPLAQRLRQPFRNGDGIRSADPVTALPLAIAVRKRGIATQSELLSEEEVPARLAARQVSAVHAGFASRLNRVDDPAVPRAATQMTVEGLGNGRPVSGAPMLHQRRRADENPRDAESALHASFEHERLAQDAACVIGKTLDRDHVVALHLFGLAQAGERRPPIDEDQTTAAGAFRSAPVLGRHHATLLAQHLEKVHPRLVRGLASVTRSD